MANKQRTPDARIQINVRLPQSLIDRIDKYVDAHNPTIRDRTQLIEVALEKFMRPSP